VYSQSITILQSTPCVPVALSKQCIGVPILQKKIDDKALTSVCGYTEAMDIVVASSHKAIGLNG
jgi:hypothetical protein